MGRHSLKKHAKQGSTQFIPSRDIPSRDVPSRDIPGHVDPARRSRAAHAAEPNALHGYLGAIRASVSVGLMAASVASIAGPAALAGVGAPLGPLVRSTDKGDAASSVRADAPPAREGSHAATRRARQKADSRGQAKSGNGAKQRSSEDARDKKAPRKHEHRSSDREPDNVRYWIRKAIKIMQKRKIPVLQAHIDEIATIIQKESSGNPRAINLWDSNAKAGIPSKGLMQTIDPTFDAYKLPGYNDIYDPVDNIVAGVRYTLSRYGGFDNHPGLKSMARGGGYRGY